VAKSIDIIWCNLVPWCFGGKKNGRILKIKKVILLIMKVSEILEKGMQLQPVSKAEAMILYHDALLSDLIFAANEIRKKLHPGNMVTWIIDRNVNITNVCVSQCKFCNFCTTKKAENAYITSTEQYVQKIDEMLTMGGSQLLLQGGMHPDLGLDFYTELFSTLKELYPNLKLHALGPPEVVYLAKKEKQSYEFILQKLVESGLDSLPGAGAEILSDRVRKLISPAKCTSVEWLDVMRVAHKMNLSTSATMMFGHIETKEERIDHLLSIRQVHSEKPEGHYGFVSFIPWPFQHLNTMLHKKQGVENSIMATEYLRFIALSRIVLNNITNLQPSWLTVGVPLAQMCLHAGANDMGSVMIEENVVSVAGAEFKITPAEMVAAIEEAGFKPQLRTQKFELIS
jgi:cyclic dehypoxanthinyl futalosine synthase